MAVKFGALGIAVLLHVSVFLAFVPEDAPQLEGAGSSEEVRLGSSFQNLQAARLNALNHDTAIRREPVIARDAPEPRSPEKIVLPEDPMAVEAVEEKAAVLTTRDEAIRVQRQAAGRHVAPEAQDPPPARPKELRSTRKTATSSLEGEALGHASVSARAGAGRVLNQRANSGPGRKAGAGRAAFENYLGVVQTRIHRFPMPERIAQASARVRFRIAPDGRLAALSIAESSNSPQFDQFAMNVIRKAAPFPPTPDDSGFTAEIVITGD